jgi:hypothetical protein
MLADGEWDNALEVSVSFGVPDLLVNLIEAALYDLLGRGLVSTITKPALQGSLHQFSLWPRLRSPFAKECTKDPKASLKLQARS